MDHLPELFAASACRRMDFILNMGLKSIFLQRLKKAGPLAQLVRASDS